MAQRIMHKIKRSHDRIARRDPGTRILVAVQCRRKHWLEPRLRKTPTIELVSYWEL